METSSGTRIKIGKDKRKGNKYKIKGVWRKQKEEGRARQQEEDRRTLGGGGDQRRQCEATGEKKKRMKRKLGFERKHRGWWRQEKG